MNNIQILSEGGTTEVDMETIELEINGKTFTIYVAQEPEDREAGLQNVHNLPYDEGMIFVFEEPQTVGFWMKDTVIPLDIIYIDEYFEVKEVQHGVPLDETINEVENIQFVLELNAESGVKVGDEIDLSELRDDDGDFDFDEEEDEDSTMKVLDDNGDSQMDLKGGERIFSRPNTKTLVRLAKRAYKSKLDKDYKALGKQVFKYLEVQNNKEDDFVDLPD
jgi:uncharacterized membrane protein (UPF0127 family)